MTERKILKWVETRRGNWFASNAEIYIWQDRAATGETCCQLSYDDWDGPQIGPNFSTTDEAKACAQRIQDAIDGYDSFSELKKVALVPVEVFGAGCNDLAHEDQWGYGLSDAVPSWSDCNRAEGHIYRFDEPEFNRDEGDTLEVWVEESAFQEFTAKRFSEHYGNIVRNDRLDELIAKVESSPGVYLTAQDVLDLFKEA